MVLGDRRAKIVGGLLFWGIGVPAAIVLWRGALFGFAADDSPSFLGQYVVGKQTGEGGPIGPPQYIYGHPQQQGPTTAKVGNLF